MEYNITEKPNCRREIAIRFPAVDVVPKLESEYQTTQKKLQLPGFRKGKVPISLIKKMYKKHIEDRIFGEIINQAFEQITKDNNMNPIARPILKNREFDNQTGLSIELVIDLEPKVELKEYKNIEIEKKLTSVSDKDVEKALENLREEHAMLINVEGGARPGHLIVADLQELDAGGLPIINERAENKKIKLSENESDEITRQLLGITAGQSRRITRTTMEKGPKGENRVYSRYLDVVVKEVHEKQLPGLDDEFAKDVGNFKDLEELKTRIREELIRMAEEESDRSLELDLSEEIIKRNFIEVPEIYIENYLNMLSSDIKNRNRSLNVDEATLRENYRPNAVRDLKWRIIRDKIADLENLAITDEELENYLQQMEQQGGQYSELVAKYRREPEEMSRLKYDLLERKVLDFLKRSAKVTEKILDRSEKSKLIV